MDCLRVRHAALPTKNAGAGDGDIPDPITDGPGPGVRPGRSGNCPLGAGTQGYGGQHLRPHPPPFDPVAQAEAALAFYAEHGYVVVRALGAEEVARLNDACDTFHAERGAEIDVPGQGQLFFPLPQFPEFDASAAHPRLMPLVAAILGGAERARHVECNYRAWAPVTSDYGMSWHSDDCSGGLLTLAQRQARRPYGPPDMLNLFMYLSDVDRATPAFAVVPQSRRADNIVRLREALGDGKYAEVPVHGPAGTVCIADRALIHTRLDPLEADRALQKPRRILHHVYACAGELCDARGTARKGNGQPLEVTEWAFSRGLAPRRLVESADAATRRLFSAWPAHQRAWMAAGYDEGFVSDPKSARGSTPPGHVWKHAGGCYNSEGDR